jgi:hypothetical protein
MAPTDDTVREVQKKIDKERALINAANTMRQSTNNPAVLSRLDGQIRDGRRNIEYFESKLRDIEMQRTQTGIDNMSLQPGTSSKGQNPVTPPPKDGWNGYVGSDQGGYGDPPGGYSNLSGGQGLMPPRAPYAPQGPGSRPQRPNYSKLGTFGQHTGTMPLLTLSRLDQIRYPASRPPHPAHAVAARVQIER